MKQEQGEPVVRGVQGAFHARHEPKKDKQAMATKKTHPSWSDVKTKLADFDRAGLLGLVQDLYAADKDNQAFLHARFGLGDDVLKPYKTTIDRWLWPDVFKNQDISVAKAKKAIADYQPQLWLWRGRRHGRLACRA